MRMFVAIALVTLVAATSATTPAATTPLPSSQTVAPDASSFIRKCGADENTVSGKYCQVYSLKSLEKVTSTMDNGEEWLEGTKVFKCGSSHYSVAFPKKLLATCNWSVKGSWHNPRLNNCELLGCLGPEPGDLDASFDNAAGSMVASGATKAPLVNGRKRGSALPGAPIPNAWLEHLKLREGFRTRVYRDSLGKKTVGLGHLLVGWQKVKWGVGFRVPDATLDRLTREDTMASWRAAERYVAQLPAYCRTTEFTSAVASLCFQLGNYFPRKYVSMWRFMKRGQWQRAKSWARASKWARQTPVRVRDWAKAIDDMLNASKASYFFSEEESMVADAANSDVDAPLAATEF